MATTVTYKYTSGETSPITSVNYHSEATSTLSDYFQQRIPKYSILTNATVVARVKTSLSSKADIKYFFANGDSDDHRTTVFEQPNAVGNSFVNITGEMKSFWNSGNANVGKCSSQYSRLYVYMNATVIRRFTIDWITYNLTYTGPQLTLNVTSSDESMGTVSGGGTFEVSKTAQTKTLKATPKPGYRFVKWQGYSSSTSANLNVSFSDNEVTGNKVTWYFTAVFEPVPYTISFIGNGHTHGSMGNISAVFGQSITLENKYSRQHYIRFDPGEGTPCDQIIHEDDFAGFSDENAIAYNGTSYPYSQFDAPFYSNYYPDLYAAFGYNKYALIEHYVNNGIREGRSATGPEKGLYPDGAVLSNLTTAQNAYVPLKAQWSFNPIILPGTARTGYTFAGWYEDSEFTTLAGFTGDEYYPTASRTLFAKWERNPGPLILSVELNPNPAHTEQGYIIAVGLGE